MSNNRFFIPVNGTPIEVSEEVYRAYKQPLWAEHKRKEREKRCIISNGKGSTKRCMNDCSKCDKQRKGSALSLDRFEEEYGFEPSENVDIADMLLDKMLLEDYY